jgi:hypothetical protein
VKLVVGITGATGVIYGIRSLQALKELSVETHLDGRARGIVAIHPRFSGQRELILIGPHVHDRPRITHASHINEPRSASQFGGNPGWNSGVAA